MMICPLTVIYLILLYNRLFNNSPAVVVLIDRLMHRVMSIVPSRSGVSTVGPSGARAPLTFSLLNVIIK